MIPECTLYINKTQNRGKVINKLVKLQKRCNKKCLTCSTFQSASETISSAKNSTLSLRDSMYRALSYSARLDQPAAGKVLETANGGCLVDQKSGTENYKWSVRGKGMETWPKAFSKYHF